MNSTPGTGINPSNGVYPGLAKADKGPLESPLVRVVQDAVRLESGEFRTVKAATPVLTPSQKRLMGQITRVETRDSSSQVSSPDSSPEEVAPPPQTSKTTEPKEVKSGAGKKEKQKRTPSPAKAPSPASPLGSPVSPRELGAFSFRPGVEVEEPFTFDTTPVTRQPSSFRPAEVATDGVEEVAAQPEAEEKEVEKEEAATETKQTEIKADKSPSRSKIKLLGVISLIAGIALAAFGFYTANVLAVNCGLGMMGVGSISYLIGRRMEAQARKQYLEQFKY